MNTIIIGAARSGTNMLRDTLVKFNDFATWPCDEINYIWRYGLRDQKDDVFLPSHASKEKKEYIRKKFNWVRKKYNVRNVVEKTCANSLRVDYVNELVDDAKYVFIFRDPIDVVSSAEIRWKSKLDLKYTLDKARFIPVGDLPYYASNYLVNRMKKFFNREKRLSYWGPKYQGFEKDAGALSALEISAIQWLKSVEASEKSFLNMDPSKYIAVNYNDFVKSPETQLNKILNFLGYDLNEQEISDSVKKVSSKSIGKGYDSLTKEEIKKVNAIVGNKYETLKNTFIND
ncbi:sulfotransferase family protein [Virgibacillus sp. MSP4-1]|uniref:sulfotransferase family protein n=1 Tax=Virgibacillus sp. MSP4-1 TaxID=2700081 RepID=UPI00039D27ED|nr:sulfotransferase [Virgibacillus sp. MSP4-1]QHS23480.1 sulfotransferase family protein [Virgibacillus sp. MSP4-1]